MADLKKKNCEHWRNCCTPRKDLVPIVEDISMCSYRYWLISESLSNKTACLTLHNKLHVHQHILIFGFYFQTDN